MAADPEPTDTEIEARLLAVPPGHWDAIWTAFAEVTAEDDHVRWEGGKQIRHVDGVEKVVWQMPYAVYSEAVERLRTSLGGLIVVFAWPQWEGVRRYRGGAEIAEAPVADAVRLITAVLRSERFSEGSIGGAIDDDTLPAAVRRLRSWHEARAEGVPR